MFKAASSPVKAHQATLDAPQFVHDLLRDQIDGERTFSRRPSYAETDMFLAEAALGRLSGCGAETHAFGESAEPGPALHRLP